MIRLSLRLLCAAGSHSDGHEGYNYDSHDPNKQYDYMTLQRACTLFDYKLSDRFEKKELKKRFNKLALKYHPDHGGSEKQFQTLIEAHKLLQSHRHDKGGKEGRFKFHKAKPASAEGERTRPTKENPFGEETDEDRKFDRWDVFAFFFVFTAIISYYLSHALYIQSELQRKRARLTEEEMEDPSKLLSKNDWHPWGATQHERDEMDRIAVIQGSMSEEALREKQRLKGDLGSSPFSC